MRVATLAFALQLVVTLSVDCVHAQDRALTPLYTFAFVGVPVHDALDVLIKETSVSIIFGSDLVAGRTAHCRIANATIDRVLSCLLDGTGLDHVRLSTGTYVVIRMARTDPEVVPLVGQVFDAGTGAPLPDATVRLVTAGRYAATNRDGRFAFAAVQAGPHQVVVSHVAYQALSDTIVVGPHPTESISLLLRPRVVFVSPIVVTGFDASRLTHELGQGSVEGNVIEDAPPTELRGVFGAIAAVDGVRQNEASADVQIQGGGADEQLFLLDGIPILIPVASGGFISPFSTLALERITVRKAGFGAEYGSNLSGVVDFEQRIAPRDGEHLTVEVDPLTLNGRLTGRAPLPRAGEASWMIAARRSLWFAYHPRRLEQLLRDWSDLDRFLVNRLTTDSVDALPFVSADNNTIALDYADVHAAARATIGGLGSIQFSFYDGRNDFGIEDLGTGVGAGAGEDTFEDAYRWRNRAGRVRFEHVLSGRLLAHAEAWVSYYRLRHPVAVSLTDGFSADTVVSFRDHNDADRAGVRVGGDLAAANGHLIALGAEVTRADTDLSLALSPDGSRTVDASQFNPSDWTYSAFIADRIGSPRTVAIVPGIRLTHIQGSQKVFAEPRLSVGVERDVFGSRTAAARFAIGLYRQFLQSVDVATYNVTALVPRVRYWVPLSADRSPPMAYHTSLALSYNAGARTTVGTELYYKYQPHGFDLDYRVAVDDGQERSPFVTSRSYAYGVSVGFRYTGDHVRAHASYHFSVSRTRSDGRFDGRYTTTPWNAPHSATVELNAFLGAGFGILFRWQASFGRTWGFRHAYYDYLAIDADNAIIQPFDLSKPGEHQLPAFSQIDVGANWKGVIATVPTLARISFINITGRDNVRDWRIMETSTAGVHTTQASLAASFLPSVSVRVTPW